MIDGVSAQAPVADYTGSPRTGSASLNVQFTDTSTNTPSGWAWYFGDETYTAPWVQQTSAAGWSARSAYSVVTPDGSIVLMGGYDGDFRNDVWRSTDKGVTWTQMTAAAGWSPRHGQSSVSLPDGSIVLMGSAGVWPINNDVWRSTDYGATWTRLTANAGWSPRMSHSSVVMPDGSIVLMGGYDGSGYLNDVWRSTDYGATWTRMTSNAGWSARAWQSSVAMPDGSIVFMAGGDNNAGGWKSDVWRSTDYGATWTRMTSNAGWSARIEQSSVVMPDGSIILMGGKDSIDNIMNDVWRSTDNGATWTRLTANAEWSARRAQSSVAMPDGSIVLIGGVSSSGGYLKDVWRFVPTGSSAQNPLHTYTKLGIYQVALQAYNIGGYTSMRKTGYITVTNTPTPTPTPTITPTPTPTPGLYDHIILSPGWNFISTPKILATGSNTGSIFSNVIMDGHSAFLWDGSQNPPRWNTVQANTPIQPLYGVWIYSISETIVNLNFDTTNPMFVPAPRSLSEGWNSIGFTGLYPTSARNTYLSVQPNWTHSMGFNAITQSYQQTIFNGDPSESTTLYPTKGYWLYMRSPGNLASIGA